MLFFERSMYIHIRYLAFRIKSSHKRVCATFFIYWQILLYEYIYIDRQMYNLCCTSINCRLTIHDHTNHIFSMFIANAYLLFTSCDCSIKMHSFVRERIIQIDQSR